MSKRLLNVTDITGIKHQHVGFVIEYLKDFNPRRAAEASGFEADYGYKLKKMPEIEAAINYALNQRLESSNIDAEWLKMELVDNHLIARQTNKIGQSNAALALLGKHASVDAFAAEKVFIANDEMIRDRLLRARERANSIVSTVEKKDDDISFI